VDLVEGAHSWMHAHGLSILPEARQLIDVNLSGVAGAFGDLFNKPGLAYAPDAEALLHNLYLFYTQQHAWPGLTDNEEHTLFTENYRQRLNGRAFESLRAELKHYQYLDPRLQSLVFNLDNHSRRMNHNLIIFNNSHFENRCPFFDYALTDWALQLPLELKIGKQLHLAVLHRAAPQFTRIPYDKDYRLPTHNRLLRQMHAAFDRSFGRLAQKMGYGYARHTVYADYENYLRGELRAWAEDILFDERTIARGIFRREALRSLMDRHLLGREPWVIGKFNAIISLEMVLRRFFDA
jgi:asparagine synthetase B (glutamine-hydrolysing)